jgi:hypothetical protein
MAVEQASPPAPPARTSGSSCRIAVDAFHLHFTGSA